MFRERAGHCQQSVFDGANLLPEGVRKRLQESWATTFYRDVFCRLDESLFADLYSEEASRPNAPANVLVEMDILKSRMGWSDREEPGSEAAHLAERVLREQYEISAEGKVRLRAPEVISPESLQSPHDEDATYRTKGGESYPGGYVLNISETCDPENTAQLITDLQVAPNTTDDAALMEESLVGQAEREIGPDQVTTDGGYTGPDGEAACEAHETELRPTRLRGGRSDSDRLGWDDYEWETNKERQKTRSRDGAKENARRTESKPLPDYFLKHHNSGVRKRTASLEGQSRFSNTKIHLGAKNDV